MKSCTDIDGASYWIEELKFHRKRTQDRTQDGPETNMVGGGQQFR